MSITTLPTITTNAAAPRPTSRTSYVLVRPLDDAAGLSAWASYVRSAHGASVFHTPEWCASVAAVFGHRPLHLRATRGTETVGILPLMEVDSFLAGRLHVSVPYGTYGGLLADDPAAAQELAAEAVRVADERQARVLELRSAEAVVPEFTPLEGYLGFTRTLPERPEDVAAFLPKRARAAARHARDRDGVVVRHDNDQLRTMWGLYSRSMRRIGSINYPYRFFEELVARFGERAWVSVAHGGARPLAGTLSLVFGETIMPYVLGADDRVRCDGAANLLYWSVMERAVAAGLRTFDYGRSRAGNSGAVGFKKNQGFEPRPLGYQRYVPPGRQAPDLRPSNPRFALARRAWQQLPLVVTRALGAWLSRSIPG